ncbi:putative Ig domain protein [Geobacter sp. OR-1]|uniref:Ig domain-containing protein n=1 Tax=Geobacter sp. OR-1 TaxID=1266765 RepID=UPI0005421B82|nr:Ig domain-containing protein [Geobacter sp. OR-1]GAM10926.1 putative Ig domain protein [Geobacter sp. OR-1]
MNRLIRAIAVNLICYLLAAGSSAFAAAAPCTPLTMASRAMPAASDGKAYKEPVQRFGGVPPVSFMVTSGMLPPGLKLSPTGELAGIPTSAGLYEFTVAVTDSCRPLGQSASAVLSLFVNKKGESLAGPELSVVRKAPLKVSTEVFPNKVNISAGPDTKVVLRYQLTAQPAETATLESPGVSFVVNGSVAETMAAPLTVVLVNGAGVVEETVRISQRALDLAAREKAAKIVFSRAFIGRKTTTIAVVEFLTGQ